MLKGGKIKYMKTSSHIDKRKKAPQSSFKKVVAKMKASVDHVYVSTDADGFFK